MKSIVIFNNKGGVGKTTLLCNLASFLGVKMQKKVLIIDADPQCNASIYLFPYNKIDEFYGGNSNETVYKIINPLKRGKGYLTINEIPITHSDKFGGDVILGDTRLAILEDFLSSDWIDGKTGEHRGLQTTFVFKDLLLKLQEQYDYIFFDVGPSLGAINRIVLLACDYFIIPMSSDIFSLKAIDNISESLKEWKKNLERGLDDYKSNEGYSFMLNNNEIICGLRFIGYVNQQYTAKKIDGNKRPVKAYDKIIKKMPAVINTKLHPFYIGLDANNLLIGEIPTLNSLIPLSQSANKPIFMLQGVDGVVGAHFKKVSEFEGVIKQIANNVLENINRYDYMAR